jgi:hypothetical protein
VAGIAQGDQRPAARRLDRIEEFDIPGQFAAAPAPHDASPCRKPPRLSLTLAPRGLNKDRAACLAAAPIGSEFRVIDIASAAARRATSIRRADND